MSDRDALWSGARIGVLGGTFDPPHVGHIRMATAALDVLALDRVLMSVAPAPPHKEGADVTDYAHRLAMIEAAIDGVPGLAVTRIEESHAPSYTTDLLRACRARTEADLYFIMGADSLCDLPAWHAPDDILRLCTLVVFPRDRAPVVLNVEGDASVVVFEAPRVDVSSSDIRLAIERGDDAGASIPGPVAEYIGRHGLYRAA